MNDWLKRSFLVFGGLSACILAGIIGGFAGRHIKASTDVSYADFIVIILTAQAVIIAALTLFIGILAYLGWSAISRGSLLKAEQIIRKELVKGGKLQAVVTEELKKIQYSGIEGLEGGANGDGDGHEEDGQ